MTYTTPPAEMYRLFETDAMTQKLLGADNGRTLDSVLSTYYGVSAGLAGLTQTFEDEFDDIAATMGNNDGGKTWMCPSENIGTGASVAQPFSAGNYTQVDATTLGMIARRDAGIANRGCNGATAFYGANLDAQPVINWCQQFGYFEAKFKGADPSGSNAVTYPAFWLRSLNFFGGTGSYTGDVFRTNIEDDIIEQYNADPLNSLISGSQDRGLHTTLHHHEPQKLIGPGQMGRDFSSQEYVNSRTYSGFGNPADFEMWNDYHLYSVLHAPDFNWYFFDRKLYGKLVRTPEMQEKYAMYISNGISIAVSPGWTSGVDYVSLWDYVKCYQHPDWQTTPLGASFHAGALGSNQMTAAALTGGGTANVKTLSSVLAMVAYANKRSFVAKFGTANTAACTLNVNAIGAKNIYKYPNTDVFPPTGTPVALTGGEIGVNEWKYFSYDTSLNGGAGGFLLWNPNYSMERPARWAPATLTRNALAVDIEAVEAGLVKKHNIDPTLFPTNHPARAGTPLPTFTAPQMAVSRTLLKVSGLTQGTSIGTVAVTNTPTDTIRYHQVGGTSHYTVNPATGEITVATGYTTTLGTEEFLVYAWPTTPRPLVRGSNATRVLIDIRADDDFDLTYFDALALWLDAQTAASLTVDGSNNVTRWADRSDGGYQYLDDDTISTDIPPIYSATGLNSLPAVLSTTPALKILTSYLGLSKASATKYADNIITRTLGTPATPRLSVSFAGTSRYSKTYDYTQAGMGLFVWTKNPSSVTFWANGVEVGIDPTSLQTGITQNGWALAVFQATTAGGSSLGMIFSQGRLFDDTTNVRQFDGALGELATGADLLTQSLIDKIFGYAALRWNLRGLLPAAHPYKATTPKMWR